MNVEQTTDEEYDQILAATKASYERAQSGEPMIRWTYCKTDVPEYLDVVRLARAINYNKRRMLAILLEPASNGFSDVFAAREAVNTYIIRIEALCSEYRYMSIMFVGGRIA